MFETSTGLFILHLSLNILLPLIPGILFVWIFRDKKFNGLLLYLISRFIWIGVVSFSLLNLQFLRFGIGRKEYLLIISILSIIFITKLIRKKLKPIQYLQTLKIKIPISQIKIQYKSLNTFKKIFLRFAWLFTLIFLVNSFIATTSFPTYADDSFNNRHRPVVNIIEDGGVKLFWAEDKILARGRLGYPLMIPIYKATISDFAWGFNDIYANIWQRLIFFALILFVITITYKKTKDPFLTILPAILISWLPLIYFHAIDGYMEIASAVYAIITIRTFYKILKTKDLTYFPLAIIFWSILVYIKNDGFIVYLPGIIIAFLIILSLHKRLWEFFKNLFNKEFRKTLLWSIASTIYFFIPFLAVKTIHWLWFNQAAAWAEQWLSTTIHREIFNQFGNIFIKMDNFNLVLPVIFAILIFIFGKKLWKNKPAKQFLIISVFSIFIIFLLVFLLTENYKRVLNQTTVNRVFTMCFVILFAFSWYLFHQWEN